MYQAPSFLLHPASSPPSRSFPTIPQDSDYSMLLLPLPCPCVQTSVCSVFTRSHGFFCASLSQLHTLGLLATLSLSFLVYGNSCSSFYPSPTWLSCHHLLLLLSLQIYKYSNGHQEVESPFQGRLQWNGSKDLQDVSITVLNVTLNDSGLYTCNVSREFEFEAHRPLVKTTRLIPLRVTEEGKPETWCLFEGPGEGQWLSIHVILREHTSPCMHTCLPCTSHFL